MLVEPRGDGVHLRLTRRLLQLASLLGQGALHHGRLGQGAVWVLETRVDQIRPEETRVGAPAATGGSQQRPTPEVDPETGAKGGGPTGERGVAGSG